MKCKNCNNFGCSYRNSFEKCFYQDDYLDEDFDWQSFRAEAAKNILAGILAHANICISETDKTRLTKLALSYTEELIRQLKEKEEK